MTHANVTEREGPPPARYEPDDRWVPVDRRWFGLDRTTILPAAIVLAVAIVMSIVIPQINDAVSYDDPVVAGDVMELQYGITFVPAPGWGITDGVREADTPVTGSFPPRAALVNGGAMFTVYTAPFTGDAQALLEQIKKTSDALATEKSLRVSDDSSAITTESGIRGVLTSYSNSSTDGVIAAFVVDGKGIEVVSTGPSDVAPAITDDIARMIVSIGHRTGEGK
ncbi:hypothetical protein DBV08_13070 [Rhodococcus sp. KBW08]|jgi:hypothetical protein|uniref:hypothetical protein n=1 Tax=Rhodococcus TaxID=1827 RepID=UPI000F5A90B5|nr:MULTISPECIES: hypothetical protein [Rhodococcus]QQM23685.1 hypothetical protein I7X09_09495 [Rhodococcus sp. P-2]RQO48300.1 hypothetical protein DBV08_13070 [Rhodococcus sp. KBW08]UJC80322.1 hypothetical protein D4768_23535 [Rhodococcus erythropolis]